MPHAELYLVHVSAWRETTRVCHLTTWSLEFCEWGFRTNVSNNGIVNTDALTASARIVFPLEEYTFASNI